jgi:hypothetical protein
MDLPNTNSLGHVRLLETSLITLKLLVVNIDTRDGRIVLFILLLGVEDKDGQVFHDNQLDLGDVVRVHPVFGRVADKGVRVPVGKLVITLELLPTGGDDMIDGRKPHNDGVIILFVEGLGVEADVEDGLEQPSSLFLHDRETKRKMHIVRNLTGKQSGVEALR